MTRAIFDNDFAFLLALVAMVFAPLTMLGAAYVVGTVCEGLLALWKKVNGDHSRFETRIDSRPISGIRELDSSSTH